ncbi:hypothetical protein V3F56_03210 [Moorellaceae bacterium AZ2]
MAFLRKFFSDRRASSFIENGLWIIVVVLLVAGAGFMLANEGIKPKLEEIKDRMANTVVPEISGE